MTSAPGSLAAPAARQGRSALSLRGFLRSRFSFDPLDWGIAALVFVGAFALGAYQLAGASLWFDETYSLGLAGLPLLTMWRYILGHEPNMQLYYLTLHIWLTLTAKMGFHPTEAIARLPSAFFAALSSVAVYLLGRRFLGQTAGVISAILYSLSFYTLMIAQQARSYSMQMLFVIIAWHMLFGALNEEGETRWWWALYTLFTTLAFYAHLYTFFIIVAQLVGLAALLILPGPWRSRARRAVRPAIISLAVTCVLILPLINEARYGGHLGWVPVATFKDIHDILLYYVSGGNPVYLYALLALIVCGVALVSLARLRPPRGEAKSRTAVEDWLTWRLQAPRPGMALLLCWLIVPFSLTYAITQPYLNLHFFFNRYEVIIMPAICLLAGLAVQSIPMRALQVVVSVALLEVAAVSAPYYYSHAEIQDFRDPVAWLQARYQAGDGIVCFPNELCSMPVQAYLNAYPSAAHFDADSPGAYSWVKGYAIPPTVARVEAYAARHNRVFYIVATLGGTKSDGSVDAAIRQWLSTHYVLSGQASVSGVVVFLYTRRPPAAAPAQASASATAPERAPIASLPDTITQNSILAQHQRLFGMAPSAGADLSPRRSLLDRGRPGKP